MRIARVRTDGSMRAAVVSEDGDSAHVLGPGVTILARYDVLAHPSEARQRARARAGLRGRCAPAASGVSVV